MAVASSQPPSFLSESEGSASGEGERIHGAEPSVVVRFETGRAPGPQGPRAGEEHEGLEMIWKSFEHKFDTFEHDSDRHM